ALLVQVDLDLAGVGVKTDVIAGVTDVTNDVACDRFVVDLGVGGDFTGEYHEVGRAKGFASDTRHRILCEDRVEHAVGNLIADFVRMPLTDGFTREQVIRHQSGSWYFPDSRELRF